MDESEIKACECDQCVRVRWWSTAIDHVEPIKLSISGTGVISGFSDMERPFVDASRVANFIEAVAAATKAERTRILAALEAIKPMEEPYTRRDWAIEQKGAKEMFAKVLKAIGGDSNG